MHRAYTTPVQPAACTLCTECGRLLALVHSAPPCLCVCVWLCWGVVGQSTFVCVFVHSVGTLISEAMRELHAWHYLT